MMFHPAYSEVEQHLNSQTKYKPNFNAMLCSKWYHCHSIHAISFIEEYWLHLCCYLFTLTWQVKYKDVFLWNDLDQDQWSMITQIMVHQINQWILSQGGFVSSFDTLMQLIIILKEMATAEHNTTFWERVQLCHPNHKIIYICF